MRQIFLCMVVAITTLVACTRNLSPEEQANIKALRAELEATKKEISGATTDNARYSGGAIKALITLRMEVLKTNEALIEQRIHAIESGAKVTVETVATKIDPERAKQLETELTKQELKVSEAEAKASAYSGGLVGAMALMATATERTSLAMLRQQYLIAKYGLASPHLEGMPSASTAREEIAPGPSKTPASSSPEEKMREQILNVTLVRKRFANQEYQDYIFFDMTFDAKGLDKPARAIKGVLKLSDLFGEQKFGVKWTIEKPIAPGTTYTERGSGFKYNQFTDSHQWVRNTEIQNMRATFRVDSILYEDGTTRNFD